MVVTLERPDQLRKKKKKESDKILPFLYNSREMEQLQIDIGKELAALDYN